jgi:hypothetical protein
MHPWPAPDIGAHTVEVCTDILGMSREEIDALVAEEVLEVAEPAYPLTEPAVRPAT